MADSISFDEIAEVIGESGSVRSQMPPKQSSALVTQLQNFFRGDSKKEAAAGKDPLSLISIFAKRNGAVPTYEKGRSLKADKASAKDKHASRRSNNLKGRKVASTDSAIEEEYSNDFSDSVPKEQSIIEEDMPKNTSSSGSHRVKQKSSSGRKVSTSKSPFRGVGASRGVEDSIAEEMIDEESF